jgi:4-hydroxy-tetrahydrodipicolinate reductase
MKLAVTGVGGRMGGAIAALGAADQNVQLAALFERAESALLGKSLHGVTVTDGARADLRDARAVIDFTAPASTVVFAAAAKAAGAALVVGTTGLEAAHRAVLEATAKAVPVVFSPNMSLSANILFDVAERVARALPRYDVEISEIHHNKKKDAPSGTAKRLAESVQRGHGSGTFVYGREGQVGERPSGEIGVHAVRGGDVVGDHTVFYFGEGERIELVHRVTSRTAFAAGAIAAAKWAVGKPAGLYDMRDVLGLK